MHKLVVLLAYSNYWMGYTMNEGLLELVVRGGAFALMAWAFIWILQKWLPDLQASFKAEATEQRKSFELEVQRQQELFRTEMRASREIFTSTLREIESGFIKQVNELFVKELHDQRADFKEELSRQRHSMVQELNLVHLEKQELANQLAALTGTATIASQQPPKNQEKK